MEKKIILLYPEIKMTSFSVTEELREIGFMQI